MTTTPVSLDDDPVRDEPTDFTEAAQAFLARVQEPLTETRVTAALAWLARGGYIVSPAEHERLGAEYAAHLAHVEQAANDLVGLLERSK